MSRPQYASATASVGSLAQPITFAFSGKTARNRFVKAAMSERMSSWDESDRSHVGIPTDRLIKLYNHWGEVGEIGIIVTGTISVDAHYLEAPGNSLIPLDEATAGHRFDQFSKLAAASKQKGSLAVGQLTLHGRQTLADINPDPVSASDVHLDKSELGLRYNKPHPASEAEIAGMVKSFSHAARYLEAAGWDGVQLNAAHGYIFSQFLSPATNKRTDRWGGELSNRARLLIDTVRAIRESCPASFFLSVKLNCVDFDEDGFSLADVKQVCTMLEAAEADAIELSGGTYREFGWKHVRDSSAKRECYFIEEAERIKPLLSKTKLYATGGWKSAGAMVDGLKTLDGIGLGRPLAQDPTLCGDILAGRVTGATQQDLNQGEYAPTAVLAGAQMRAISEGLTPIDGSKPETSALLFERLKSFMEQRLGGLSQSGHLELSTAMAAVPYATSQH